MVEQFTGYVVLGPRGEILSHTLAGQACLARRKAQGYPLVAWGVLRQRGYSCVKFIGTVVQRKGRQSGAEFIAQQTETARRHGITGFLGEAER